MFLFLMSNVHSKFADTRISTNYTTAECIMYGCRAEICKDTFQNRIDCVTDDDVNVGDILNQVVKMLSLGDIHVYKKYFKNIYSIIK